MNFILMSDLHLEGAPSYRPDIQENEKQITLILAGDICEVERLHILIPFLRDMAERFQNVIYVPGNHEYYNGHMYSSITKLLVSIKQHGIENVHLLNNGYVTIDYVNIICSTLWTNFNKGDPLAMWDVERGLNDYLRIKTGDYHRIRTPYILAEHNKSLNYLEETLTALAGQANMVVTHHAPSALSIASAYAGDSLNPAYISDLSDFVDKHKPLIWCHGHVHNSFDYMLYDTRVICNPRGYESKRGIENQNFTLSVFDV